MKWLPKSTDNTLNSKYPKSSLSYIFKPLLDDKGLKCVYYTYYELSKEGILRFIIKDRSIASFVAGKYDLDIQEVEFTEKIEYVDMGESGDVE